MQLLERPSPGSTSADLISQVMVHLNVLGNAYLAKFRADGEIVQLGLLHPTQVEPELRARESSIRRPSTDAGWSWDRRMSATSRR